jgi:COP9 signalosome complex subunit 5
MSKADVTLLDEVYKYDDAAMMKQWKEKPWKSDPMFFQNVRINVLAATKMVKHAVSGVHRGRKKGGLPIEVMGLLLGRTDGSTIIIMDAIELPIEGSETKVVADDESVLGFMTRMQDRVEELRKDRFIGWYHSHPFDVGVHSNAFFSATDVNTQLMWQLQFGKWVGIVVDPLRSLFKQKIELDTFMAYPPSYDPPKQQGPDMTTDANTSNLTDRWGAAYNRYYCLKHSYFMGSLVRHNLEMMSRKHLWIRHLSSSAIMEPESRSELPKRIATASDGIVDPKSKRGRKSEEAVAESIGLGRDIAIEQCIGHSTQLIKKTIFNTAIEGKSEVDASDEKSAD